MLGYFLSGLGMGLAAAGSIGPVNLEILRRGLTRGPWSALGVGLGAVTIDCFYFSVAVLATEWIKAALESPWTLRAMLFAGGAVLAWLGAKGLRLGAGEVRTAVNQATREETDTGSMEKSNPGTDRSRSAEAANRDASAATVTPDETRRPATSVLAAYPIGLAMTLANPVTVAFWISVAASMVAAGSAYAGWIRFSGVAVGVLGWVAFFITLIAFARRFVTPALLRGINIVSGLTLLCFGLYAWWRMLLI